MSMLRIQCRRLLCNRARLRFAIALALGGWLLHTVDLVPSGDLAAPGAALKRPSQQAIGHLDGAAQLEVNLSFLDQKNRALAEEERRILDKSEDLRMRETSRSMSELRLHAGEPEPEPEPTVRPQQPAHAAILHSRQGILPVVLCA